MSNALVGSCQHEGKTIRRDVCPFCEVEAYAEAVAKARAEHVNDVAIGERRLIRCEKERDAARASLTQALAVLRAVADDSGNTEWSRQSARAALTALRGGGRS